MFSKMISADSSSQRRSAWLSPPMSIANHRELAGVSPPMNPSAIVRMPSPAVESSSLALRDWMSPAVSPMSPLKPTASAGSENSKHSRQVFSCRLR